MELLQETTVWNGNTPNHIYLLDGSGKCVAYRCVLNGEWMIFKKSLSFSKTRRKFKKLPLTDVPFDLSPFMEKPAGKAVQGSNGAVYYVNEGTCTCPAFKFRRKCKHL